jgi:hypothetical protein
MVDEDPPPGRANYWSAMTAAIGGWGPTLRFAVITVVTLGMLALILFLARSWPWVAIMGGASAVGTAVKRFIR